MYVYIYIYIYICMHTHTHTHTHTKSITLSKHIWQIAKEMAKSPIIKWDIPKKAKAYKGDISCRLCQKEKWCILKHSKNKLQNQKSELISMHRYVNRFYFFCVMYPLTNS